MTKYSSYLVCHKYINEVKQFLSQFFEEKIYEYSHEEWISFNLDDFTLSLMKGNDQVMTQNATFEIACKSLEELEKYATKFDCKIESFDVTKV